MFAPAFSHFAKDNGKLAPCLLLAIAVHVMALYFLKPPSPLSAIPQPAPTLEVYLSPPPGRRAESITAETLPKAVPREANISPISSNSTPVPPTRSPSIEPQPEAIPASVPHIGENQANLSTPSASTPSAKPVPLSVQALLDSASRISKEDEKYLPHPKTDHPPLADRPILGKLATVLADKGKAAPGITQYAEGMIKVVTAYGTVYCTQNTPNLAKTGPLDPENIPMTCP